MSKLGKQILSRIRARTDPPGRTLIRTFCEAVEQGEQPARETLEGVAAVLRGILDDPHAHQKVKAALGLSASKGRPARASISDRRAEILIATEVEKRRRELCAAGMEDTRATQQAVRDVTQARFGAVGDAERKKTGRAHQRHRKTVEPMLAIHDLLEGPARLAEEVTQRLEEERAKACEQEEKDRAERERKKLYEGGLFD